MSAEQFFPNEEDIIECDTESIAHNLFSKEPHPEGSIGILSDNASEKFMIFEILLNIYMEGLLLVYGSVDKIDLKNMNEEDMERFNPYFKSMGFKYTVKKYSRDESDQYEKYYCRVIMRDHLYSTFFEMKSIEKDFHFLLNGNYLEENENESELKNLFCIFGRGNDIFAFHFDYHVPTTLCG